MNDDTELKPTHARCIECSQDTELDSDIEDLDDFDEQAECENCRENGRDPHVVVPVAIIPCPNGVTADDWIPGGFINGKDCDDENHEPRSGLHVVDIEH